MMRIGLFLLALLVSCVSKQKEQPRPEDFDTDTTTGPLSDEFQQKEIQNDFTNLYGVYDHQSTTSTFRGVVSLRQSGLDIYGTVSVVQGSCKAETESIIVMAERTEDWYIGFADIENCVLQFTFYLKEPKLDIKEVMLCTLHGSTCSFEGIYVKRKTE